MKPVIEENASNQSQQQDNKPDTGHTVDGAETSASPSVVPSIQPRSFPEQSGSQIATKPSEENEQSSPQVGEKDMKPFERKMIWLTILAIGIATITGAVFYVQLRVMTYQTQILASQAESAAGGAAIGELNTRKQLVIAQKQADAAEKAAIEAAASLKATARQFREQERPYLWPIKMEQFRMVKGEQIRWNIFIGNYGRSPAITVSRITICFGRDAMGCLDRYFSRMPKKLPRNAGSVAIVQPTAATGPLANDLNVLGAYSNEIATEDDIKFITQHRFSIVIGGRIEYDDTHGGSYRSTFCVQTDTTKIIIDCRKHQQP